MKLRYLALMFVASAMTISPLWSASSRSEGKTKKTSPGTRTLEMRQKMLSDLLAEHWEYTLEHSPEQASLLGDKRWNDKLTDFSQKAIDQNIADARKFLSRFEAIDSKGFSDQEVLNKTLIIQQLRETVEDAKYKPWRMPVNQLTGVHLDATQLVNYLSFSTVKDYDDYVKRLQSLPRVINQTIAQMKRGMAEGLMPPKYLLVKVVEQTDSIAKLTAEGGPFGQPLSKLNTTTFSEADKKRIRESVLATIDESVLPAYSQFSRFVREEYAPKGRTEAGVWSLPAGKERYAVAVKRMTTTNLTPEQIHEIGLREVDRIETEMLDIAKKLGYTDLKSFNEATQKYENLRTKSREDILERYRKHIEEMNAKLPELFGRLPKSKVLVTQVEEFREKQTPGAHYVPGALDGSRPGTIVVNTGGFGKGPALTLEATAYHEGVPGHHMQLAIAQELPSLPPFRQNGYFGAFIEGWGLYSESLGKEVGMYADPYSDYGRLGSEIFRAIRLVVDTGMHSKKWTRQQALDYMAAHGSSGLGAEIEIDRYIVWPGQALSYKIGALKIAELRKMAEAKLGEKFDIRGFHDELLGGGALPLDVVETRIHQWIDRRKNAS